MRISLVIPFHNEEESLKELLPAIEAVRITLSHEFEILLVDDCSSDRSAAFVREFSATHPEYRLIQLSQRGGQTGAFRAAFAEASGTHIIRMDADLQDDPADLPLFLEQLEKGRDLVMGLRTSRKHSRALRILSTTFDLLVLLLVNSPLHAHSGSFVAFRAEHVKGIPLYRNDHRYLPLIAIRRGATDCTEVIARHNSRKHGYSKYRLGKKVVTGIVDSGLFFFRLILGFYDVGRHR